ncbi:MAG: type III-A CRISPR-associated RAMP protein Csm4 [Candidatus Viridilinea halotolerans]|uniref:CRISPR system Cms protein Csm4 n=1 Tax=Candidatus Viridilinea halotolerans TaxID=2491704 RepID=A0A426TWD7_9CHLR|nr:MAG: type III-A CRISPR-associated RAMP protein Csm4 [Candidatus Viridilinea halotolerans]
MSELISYQICPPTGATTLSCHFGRQGIGLEETSETLPSDSFFAALVAQAAQLKGAQFGDDGGPLFAQPFVSGEPPFLVSSLFPRIGDLPLLPRPLLKLNMKEKLNDQIGKGFKKLRYLSPELFATVCRGDKISEAPVIMQGGKVWLSRNEARSLTGDWKRDKQAESEVEWHKRLAQSSIWKIESPPHVTVDRVSNTSAYYEVGQVTYAPHAGLVLLVRFVDATQQAVFERMLTLLSESGLGGRRSSGLGAFCWERKEPLRLGLGQGGSRAVLLSRYLPQEAELAALRSERAAYQLVRVGGWVYSLGRPSQRRQRVMMVSEGAILDTKAAAVRGHVEDVRPVYSEKRPHPQVGSGNGTSHPVYRSGLALTLAIPDAKEGNS